MDEHSGHTAIWCLLHAWTRAHRVPGEQCHSYGVSKGCAEEAGRQAAKHMVGVWFHGDPCPVRISTALSGQTVRHRRHAMQLNSSKQYKIEAATAHELRITPG